MGTTQRCMLSVYKRVVFFAILLAMCKGNLYILALQMDNGVQGIIVHAVFQQVRKSLTRQDTPAIEHYGQTCVQISVVPEHNLYMLATELVMLEKS